MTAFSEERPWGKFTILKEDKNYKTKVISVNPRQKLSYQSHSKRDETWIVVQGTAEIIIDDKNFTLEYGDNIFIKRGQKHRVYNKDHEIILKFIEVQTGDYFGEDDIIRYQDEYNRTII